jgi:hypothetical protein
VVRWINLALAVVLTALLLMELTRSDSTEGPDPEVQTFRTTVVKETPGRRARRLEARAALDEARRLQRERGARPTGVVELEAGGIPFRD